MTILIKEQINPNTNLIHNHFKDLVNNFVYYHNCDEMKTHKDIMWTNTPPSYKNYPLLENIIDDIIANPQKHIDRGSLTVRCPVSKFWTCDGNITNRPDVLGYDRLYKYNEIMAKAKERLKACDGYDPTADLLHGMVRWIFDKKGNVIDFVICKDRGNFRTHAALETNGGNDVMLAITLDFHDCNPKLKESEMRAVEAKAFFSDAKHRRGIDQETTFRSGVIGNEPRQVAQFKWLNEIADVDYAGVVTAHRIANGEKPPKYTLSSLSKLDFGMDGKAYGYFTTYGADNIKAAIGTAKKIHDKLELPNKISITLIHVLTRTFYFMTENSSTFSDSILTKNWGPLFKRNDLQDFLVWYYTDKRKDRRGNEAPVNNIAEIAGRSGGDKDISWRAFDTYLPAVLNEYVELKGRKYKVGSENPAIKAYLQSIDTVALQKQARSELDIAAA
jgi:hypothetical protein